MNFDLKALTHLAQDVVIRYRLLKRAADATGDTVLKNLVFEIEMFAAKCGYPSVDALNEHIGLSNRKILSDRKKPYEEPDPVVLDALRQDVGQLIAQLSSADTTHDNTFKDLICRSADTLRLRDEDFSKLFSISKPSVRRWKAGKSSPHPLLRQHIFQTLEKKAGEFQKMLEKGIT